MLIGLVGHEEKKFTPVTKSAAIKVIEGLISHCDTVVSGGCHLGGIDIWAEVVADNIGALTLIHLPKRRNWAGFRARNLRIARDSDIVHCIVVAKLPGDFGPTHRYESCYHCLDKRPPHVKSGGCWTAIRGKKAVWHIIDENGLTTSIPAV